MFYAFFWLIPRRLNFICRRFGTLCPFHLHRQVGAYLPMKMEQVSTYLPMKMEQVGTHLPLRMGHVGTYLPMKM
jgi:hypothetical protein